MTAPACLARLTPAERREVSAWLAHHLRNGITPLCIRYEQAEEALPFEPMEALGVALSVARERIEEVITQLRGEGEYAVGRVRDRVGP